MLINVTREGITREYEFSPEWDLSDLALWLKGYTLNGDWPISDIQIVSMD